MITEVYAGETPPISYQAAIFLVGPTPRSHEVKSWRPAALQMIRQQASDIDLVVFIPEARSGAPRSSYLEQVEWEKKYLEMADAILAWVPRNLATSLKGLTTNIEFGHTVTSGKLFYGRPDEAEQIKYLDWMYTHITGRTPVNQLETLVTTVISTLNEYLIQSDRVFRIEGEREVPLAIWSTSHFQNWYQTHRQIGNKLLNARLLWIFSIRQLNYTFAYALHVDIWIAAEDRIKSNEFIISRPDISVIVAYWRHPTDIQASEILLIKEFRSPARTLDGFVHELPGGSSFNSENSLQIAGDELWEETGLQIEADRLQYVDSKQLMATWSTHVAHVYALALEKDEIEQVKKIAAAGQHFGVEASTERTYVEIAQLKEIKKQVDWSMEGMIYHVLFNC